MNKRRTLIIAVAVVVVVAVALLCFILMESVSTNPAPQSPESVHAVFVCSGGRSIDAEFVNASQSTTTGNSVVLTLSDGRHLTLPQTISGSGARYANANESFVFWNKGNGAFIQENGATTYDTCVTSPTQ